jgi:hypothetical protein
MHIGGFDLKAEWIVNLIDDFEAEHAQRKQLESRVEKLRSSQVCLFSNDGCRKREPRPLYWCRCCMTLAADDALAKEQPRE